MIPRESTISLRLHFDSIRSSDTSVSLETILNILAKISDLHIMFEF
nr:MAG TPA: hypothetical protein [Caudoviricetes sp.]DAR49076.1 MAG TPA: hypothetical protein [Caudoviricetes sp.]